MMRVKQHQPSVIAPVLLAYYIAVGSHNGVVLIRVFAVLYTCSAGRSAVLT
jgi:hypothetical protein